MATAAEAMSALAGVSAGYPVSPCTACGMPVLAPPKSKRSCRMTPGCKGKHVPLAERACSP